MHVTSGQHFQIKIQRVRSPVRDVRDQWSMPPESQNWTTISSGLVNPKLWFTVEMPAGNGPMFASYHGFFRAWLSALRSFQWTAITRTPTLRPRQHPRWTPDFGQRCQFVRVVNGPCELLTVQQHEHV